MKRLRVDETVKEGGGPLPSAIYRQPISNSSTSSYNSAGTIKVVSEGMQTGVYPSAPSVNYTNMPTVAVTHAGHGQIRNTENSPPVSQEAAQQQSPGSNFHRLKVEDALSYLDLVKFKFNSKPQVYNDFLDIMKEFKSQSIDTPGVIERVSNLFDGFPDLIVGFNTFLPPGYKIEVQKNNDGYAFHVSVSMGNMAGGSDNHHKTSMIMKGSGTYNTSVCGQPITHTQQNVPVPPHISPVPPQAPPPQPPVVQHSSNTYTPNATSYNSSLSLSAAQAAVSQALQGHNEAPPGQPVEFNHAINYVNKIKNRFQGQPEKYKRFLEILHTYQKEQRTLKESSGGLGGKQLTEQEVYSQVAKLFENQSDLLAEFGQFLPDATSHMNQVQSSELHASKKLSTKPNFRENIMERNVSTKMPIAPCHKRSLSPYSAHRESHPQKKHKLSSGRDVTLAEAGKYGTLKDYAFFDKLRKAVKSYEVYENFLRCLTLYNEQIVTRSELILMINPLIGKFPDLMRWFRDFLRQSEMENVPFNVIQNERPKGDLALEIDFSTAKRLGASYCVIPDTQEIQVSSNRTQLCKDVLNDHWVSFPTWSEDSTFVGSRKTQYEEYMYRCEDERFELDVVIENNSSTIRVLENIQKKINRMKPEEVSNFTLDDNLGGTSAILHQKALKRIYGERAKDIIDGLKSNPAAAIGTVLARLKSKEVEWREAQTGFNKIWREQNEKYYLKSLDHQGMNFKATDVKALRSKSLFNEIEALFDERHEHYEETGNVVTGPHIVLPYKDKTILDDATNLLIHNVKRQTGIQKSEKRKIKQFLFRTLPEFFFHPKQHLSDDEGEGDDINDVESPNSSPSSNGNSKCMTNCGKSPARLDPDKMENELDIKEHILPHAQTNDPEEAYTLFMGNNNWYIFLRLHAILCERLSKIYERSVILAEEEARQQPKRKESTAISLRLKPKPQIDVQDYYPAFLDMVKNLLDGNMDANAYEDTLREMYGIYAYIAFTLDKVVSNAVRQLQHCVTEKTAKACTDLFVSEQKKGATGGHCMTAYKRAHIELAYQRAAEKAVQDENCFKIFIYKKDCRMTIELLDTENDDGRKVEESKKWSIYKESYSDCLNTGKIKSPVFLERNLRLYKKRAMKNSSHVRRNAKSLQKFSSTEDEKNEKENSCVEDINIESELRGYNMPERNQTHHPGYHIVDDTECNFNFHDSKIVFTSNKDSYIYKISALERAKESHPSITMRLSTRFKYWLKGWLSENVSDTQHKQCMEWLMGRSEGVVPNRTRILTDNDTSRPPYMSYNRYKVEHLLEDGT